jgi:hypothetical protein
MANSYRLRQALLRRYAWLSHFFHLVDGLLTPRAAPLKHAGSLKEQYAPVAQAYPEALVWCQVGCFYECYDAGAVWAKTRLGFAFTLPRRGFFRQCGVPLAVFPGVIQRLVSLGRSVCVVREMATSVGPVKTRCVAAYWEPLAHPAHDSETLHLM